MKGAGCWIRVKEVNPVSDLLLNLCERLCRYPCAWRLHALVRVRLSCARNNLSKLVLSLHTKFHLSVPTGTG